MLENTSPHKQWLAHQSHKTKKKMYQWLFSSSIYILIEGPDDFKDEDAPTVCFLDSWEKKLLLKYNAASCSTVQSSVKPPCPNYMLCLHSLGLPFLMPFFSQQKNSFTDNWKQTYTTCSMLLYKWNLNSHAFVFFFFFFPHLPCKKFSK